MKNVVVFIALDTSGEILYKFLESGDLHLVAEARDTEGRQVAVATRRLTVQYRVWDTNIACPGWVLRGQTYECYMYVQRGTDTQVNCTIAGEYLPIEMDGKSPIQSCIYSFDTPIHL
jgi:hypothetical protein